MGSEGLSWQARVTMAVAVAACAFGCLVVCLLGAPMYFLWFVEQVW
jgi:hypothetical protein